jgi:ATPase subunit of ABC transporter with duplicated ATPase domains
MSGQMLDEFQRTQAWENMLAAETRSLYFDDLASRYTRQKQWITGLSFFFASGAAASLIGKAPESVPTILSLLVAAMTAYSIAVGLDRRVATMAKLHSAWNRISQEYSRLWSHIGDEDAENQLRQIIEMSREPSELATTDAPNDQKLLDKWQDRVFALYHLTGQHG